MRILILAKSLHINETSSGIVTSSFIEALSLSGHQVTVLYDKSFSYDITWISENVNLIPLVFNFNSKPLIERIPKLRALPNYLYGYKLTEKNIIKKWKSAIQEILQKKKFDLIVALGSGHSFFPHIALSEIKPIIPWIANYHDPFPRSWYPYPYRHYIPIISWHQEQISKKILLNATAVTFPSLLLKEHMEKFVPTIEKKSFVIPHVHVDMDNLPTKDHDNNIELNKNKFNILHAGSLLGPRKPDYLFKAFIRLSKDSIEFKKNARLILLGKTAKEHHEISKYNENQIKIFNKRISYKKSLQLQKKADLNLVIEAVSDFSPFMPGKLADLLYFKKPVFALTPENSETKRILGKNYPYWSPNDNEEKIYSILKRAWNDWQNNKLKLPEKERLHYYVTPEHFNQLFNKILDKIM